MMMIVMVVMRIGGRNNPVKLKTFSLEECCFQLVKLCALITINNQMCNTQTIPKTILIKNEKESIKLKLSS